MGKNYQEEIWNGEFGKEYTERNIYSPQELDKVYIKQYGVSAIEMNKEFLSKYIAKNARILEIGCNVGNQLRVLQKMGFNNLYGIELQPYAVQRAKDLTKGINIIQGVADDIPFKDGYFNLVFTCGVLIHIAPENLSKVMKEINRCSNKYVWGFEYYSDVFSEINYRENKNAMWKGNYDKEYIRNCHELKIIKEKKYKYIENSNIDSMFLLSK
ncbi:pseudaminic acid biosynthesis-associated methylase [Clostridium tagluense]|uniref:pseudaminic acid biosynthesis-associated methylase n=1 Tax=Clostridium tagluense TaxID=360422 RepID=UPI001CF34A3E|nr:pseudaminic acid biosynthesis-associated methylase [Clostridium tagluense]MCB2297189.1 methyltransferase domain-containing protein [Clostridium tagluense]